MALKILNWGYAAVILVGAGTSAMAQSATQTRLLSLQNPSPAGVPVTLRAEVDGLGGGAPTGSTVFWDGTTRLGVKRLGSPAGAGQATLAAGVFQTCALSAAGGVKCWGNNSFGQLGDGTTTQRRTPVDVSGLTSGVVAIAGGFYHSCALSAAGGVKCWGSNSFGQLGDGTTTSRLTPVDVSGLTSGVVAITAGWDHSCALSAAGGVKCWGRNQLGQLGDGTTTSRLTPVTVRGLTSGVAAIAAGSFHNCALTAAGAANCWGLNRQGQLGDGTTTSRLMPVAVRGLTSGVVAIAGSTDHSCALSSAGGVKCWGNNFYGQLGDGTTTSRRAPVDVSGLTSGVVAIAGRSFSSCALTAAGGAKCWGLNHQGQLGDGTTTSRLTPVDVSGLMSGVAAIVEGSNHACVLTAAGGVKCWGRNQDSQLGDGTLASRRTPVDTQNITGLVRARAEFTTPPLTAGTHALSARYLGNATHARSIGRIGQLVQ